MKSVIFIEDIETEIKEAWGSLTGLCDKHPEFSYYYLKGKKFPFEYKGVKFTKVKYRTKNF